MIKKEKNKISFLTLLGLLLILSSLTLFVSYAIQKNKVLVEEQEQVDSYIEDTSTLEVVDEEPKQEPQEQKPKQTITYDYIAVLEIPDINLKRGLVDYNSKYNDVKYNIQIIEKSNMPDKPNGNFILAGHNGTSSVSFFRNLNKLTTDSLINVYYKGYKYIYKFNNSYEVDKDGEIEIKRDINKNTITLITCKKNSKTKQVVNIGYLVDKVEY